MNNLKVDGVKVKTRNITRVLHRTGLRASLPRKTPFLNAIDLKFRLAFANGHIDKAILSWDNIGC